MKNILCIGTGNSDADVKSQIQAKKFKVQYNGILTPNTSIAEGLYHTSLYECI